jgi:hypothetical protein
MHWPTVLSQRSPVVHAAQLAPAVPHCASLSLAQGTQVFPLQHPLGHEVASHTQAPELLLHSCPDAQLPQVAP